MPFSTQFFAMDNELVFLCFWQVKQALKGARDSDSVVESELESALYSQVWSEIRDRALPSPASAGTSSPSEQTIIK